MPDLKSIASRSPEVKSFDGQKLEFFATPRTINKLRQMKIYFGRPNNRFKPTDVLTIWSDAKIEPYACYPAGNTLFEMGAFSYSESPLPAGMKVGRYCSIAGGLKVFRDRHPIEWVTTSSVTYDFEERTGYRSFVDAQADFNDNRIEPKRPGNLLIDLPVVEHDVWIGQDVQLARGIRIGTGAVIAAGAVVTRNVAPYEIIGGVPAKVIRPRFQKHTVEGLLGSKWWMYDPSILARHGITDPTEFLHGFNTTNRLPPYTPEPITVTEILQMLDV